MSNRDAVRLIVRTAVRQHIHAHDDADQDFVDHYIVKIKEEENTANPEFTGQYDKCYIRPRNYSLLLQYT